MPLRAPSGRPCFRAGPCRSISLATVTPSLVMVGPPNFFSSTTLRPLGPRVTFTASASWLTPLQDRLTGMIAINNLFCHSVVSLSILI